MTCDVFDASGEMPDHHHHLRFHPSSRVTSVQVLLSLNFLEQRESSVKREEHSLSITSSNFFLLDRLIFLFRMNIASSSSKTSMGDFDEPAVCGVSSFASFSVEAAKRGFGLGLGRPGGAIVVDMQRALVQRR